MWTGALQPATSARRSELPRRKIRNCGASPFPFLLRFPALLPPQRARGQVRPTTPIPTTCHSFVVASHLVLRPHPSSPAHARQHPFTSVALDSPGTTSRICGASILGTDIACLSASPDLRPEPHGPRVPADSHTRPLPFPLSPSLASKSSDQAADRLLGQPARHPSLPWPHVPVSEPASCPGLPRPPPHRPMPRCFSPHSGHQNESFHSQTSPRLRLPSPKHAPRRTSEHETV